MKLSKILLILILAVTVVGCNKKDDDGGNAINLSLANLAGTYDLTFLNATIVSVQEVAGIPVTSTVTAVGSVFQVEVIFTENGTYSAEGQYLLTTTVTVGGQTEIDEEIFVIDENGTYTLDANSETIQMSGAGDFANGTLDVALFDETQLRLTQEESITTGDVMSDLSSEYRFVRQ